jgi:hypothetical protein
MIDLAEQAGEFFFEQKIWDVTLSGSYSTRRNGKRSLKKKYDMVLVQMVLFENSTPHATPEYV